MKKRIFIVAGVALVGVCLWLGTRGGDVERSHRDEGNTSRHSGSVDSSDAHGTAAVLKTKSAIRDTGKPRSTHGPERLKEFYLPVVDINGLTLREALAKLMAAYEDACAKAGEVPIPLTFDVPPTATKKLRLRLSPGNFSSSVRFLATYAGMKVNRDKTVYRFEPFADERGEVKRSVSLPPDFATRLSEQTSLSSGSESDSPIGEGEGSPRKAVPVRMTIAEILKASGLELDPSTRLSVKPSGELILETPSGADAAAISALEDSLKNDVPIQNKFTTKVLHIPADLDWAAPDTSQMTDSEIQLFMRQMSQKKGVDLLTLPEVTARGNQDASIENVRELIYPTNAEGTEFEKQQIGVTMQMKGDALAFGHDVDFQFTHTTGGLDNPLEKPVIEKHTVSGAGYTGDRGARLAVETQPDGSRVVVLLSATMIDATGQPLHGAE
ncbi:hypothetical protein [Luteolibacter yonseiensis]|uniref:hypothetical protein n=1 Tax=Luteolibacter yonseiensis TaxID=1144680 RepID=UPI001F2E10B9|nr:hypothetical protein [Luteolibacter yonseiensis]